MAEPSNKTILLTDVEGSGRRLDSERPVMRRMLYTVLHETLLAAGVEAGRYRCEDRGDGVFVLVDPDLPKPPLLRALLSVTTERLVSINRLAAAGAGLRLRMVVHAGEVALDEYGAAGADVDHAFRLLEAPSLRAELAATTEPSVLCVSDAVYRGVVHHAHPGVRREHFHPLAVDSKEGPLRGWYHDASRRHRAEDARSAPAADAPAAPAPVLRAHTGNFFLGTATIAGDAVAGDKHVGVRTAPRPRREQEGTGR
ncbi:hypothetical protein ACSMX9_10925 [Streptomyces sp. LE64]|uniref:hypothetical protein n=1 Tax=Streptomyces sp. LE64 TaxID=3448653 RepID=UPI00404321F2